MSDLETDLETTRIERAFEWAAKGDTQALQHALSADPAIVQRQNAQGINLLMWAMYHRQKDIASLVYRCIENPSAEDAVALNDFALLRVLINQDPAIVHQYSLDGFTLLHYACFFGNMECVEVLLAHDAEVNCAAHNPSGVYPLHSAAAAQSADIVERLLKAGAQPDVQQHGGYTALMSAAMHDNKLMIGFLLHAGADTSVRDDENRSAHDHGVAKGFAIAELIPKL